jgi:hypothetical protein
MTASTSSLTRVKYRGRESTTVLLEADNMSVRALPDGGAVVELFKYGADGKVVEGFKMAFCAEDCSRLRDELYP